MGSSVEFWCCEASNDDPNRALYDPILLHDDRIIQNLLGCEDRYLPNSAYFKCVQREITPCMRKTLAMWMLEVCEEEPCDDSVFTLAMNYLDRLLSGFCARKTQLQLLGTVCLFLASKLKDTVNLTADRLSYYTDSSVTVQEITEWEVILLSRLRWDLSAVTALDFLELLISRLQIPPDRAEMVKNHSKTFIDLCATDFNFATSPASMVCAASIGVAARGLMSEEEASQLLLQLSQLTSMDLDLLRYCIEQVEILVSNNLQTAQEEFEPPKTPLSQNFDIQPETPTDVRDVYLL